jgi:hypothetical protein
VCPISTVPACTASTTPSAGTSSPGACTLTSNLPPDIAFTLEAKTSEAP